MDNNKIETISNLFEDKEIRSVWDSEKEEYFFSVVDVISALTDSNIPRNYWSDLKRKLKSEGSELHENIVQLKMKAQDGKMRETDTLDTKGIFRLIESVPSSKAEPFKVWLANLGSERIDEVFDPEIAVNRAVQYYRNKGYNDEWIKARLNGIVDRFKLTDVWKEGGITKPIEYALLTNEIYTGKIINGKQEVSDFLTGQRRDKDETEWMVVERPELRIIEDETFEKAQEILRGRHDAFNLSHERQSNKHLFSTLIKCKECGWSFRRTVRTYKNTYVRWVCSGRNGRGVDSCPNKTVVDEEELIEVLQEYFTNVLKQKKKVIAHVVNEFQRVYKAKDENVEYEKELNAELAKLQKTRQKYMDMYTDDLISREELNEKIGGSRQEMERIENELKMVSYHLTKGEQLENILNNTFKEIEDITDVHQMTNQQLKRLIQKIEVDKDGNVDIYLRLLGDLGLDESVLIEENETVLNCNDQT